MLLNVLFLFQAIAHKKAQVKEMMNRLDIETSYPNLFSGVVFMVGGPELVKFLSLSIDFEAFLELCSREY